MTNNVGYISAPILMSTFTYASSPAAGGTDVTADTTGAVHGWLYVGDFSELDIDVQTTFTGGVSPTLTLNVDRALADTAPGPNQVFASNVASTASVASASTTSYSIGVGLTTVKGFGRYIRVAWTALAGGPTALTLLISIIGKA